MPLFSFLKYTNVLFPSCRLCFLSTFPFSHNNFTYYNCCLVLVYQNTPSFLPRNRLLKKERLRLTLTVMEMKTTLAQDCKHYESNISLTHKTSDGLRPICLEIFESSWRFPSTMSGRFCEIDTVRCP